MLEMRALDEHIAGLQRKVKTDRRLASTRGQEACRVSTAIELVPGDLVSDAHVGVGMDLLAGAKVGSLLRRVAALTSGTKQRRGGESSVARQMPWIEDAGDRLRMAMGGALFFKTLKHPNIVVAYVRSGEVSGAIWRRVLALAAKLELPVIFVVLPGDAGAKDADAGRLCAKARSCGMPGIPVDASDAVALYRVAQESIGRTRGDGGPVLIECVAHRLDGRRKGAMDDPILRMKEFMLGRKVCSEAWLNGVGDAFRKRMEATR
jgi:TPP-dependent pyruvate/acetoin dehydrogenase alpha subunit